MSETYFIIDAKTEPRLSALNDQLNELHDNHAERMKFIKKQIENLHNEARETKKMIWEKIERVLEEKDLIPKNYDKERHYLSFQQQGSQLFMKEREQSSDFMSFLKHVGVELE